MAKNYKSTDPCIVCLEEGEDMVCFHHVKTRKSGGTDEKFNLMPLCLRCHNEVHDVGLTTFAENYLQARRWLEENFWEFSPAQNKWHHFGEHA